MPTVHYGLTPAEKKVIFDIDCRDQNDDHFIIEMQRARQEFFADRTKSVLEYEDVQDALDYMRKSSLKEGFEKGLAEGKAEGLAEGEAKAKLSMAKLLLKQGVDINIITRTTGLTAEEINLAYS